MRDFSLAQLSKMPGQMTETKNNTLARVRTHTRTANTLHVALNSNSYDLKLIENIFSCWQSSELQSVTVLRTYGRLPAVYGMIHQNTL